VKSSYITYTIMGTKLTSSIKMSPVGLTYLYTTRYVHINLLYISLIATFFIPVVNIIEDLLLLAKSTCADPPDIKTPVMNTIENLLLLAASTCTDPLVLLP
jgi:hypothetical protein